MLKKTVSAVLAILFAAGMLFSAPVCAENLSIYANESSLSESANTATLMAEKNYPLPKGYAVKTAYNTYDNAVPSTWNSTFLSSEQNIDTANSFDSGSYKLTFKQSSRECGITGNFVNFDGDGYMFWYKSNKYFTMRLRNNSNGIVNYADIPANPNGGWITVFNYGRTEGMTYNPSSAHRDMSGLVDSQSFKICFMSGGGITTGDESTYSWLYIDEFFSFEAQKNENDIYNDEFLKYSCAQMDRESKTKADYNNGSVTITSDYGDKASAAPADIIYNLNKTAVEDALAKAKKTGYLKFTLDKNACYTSDTAADNPQWLMLDMIFTGKSSGGEDAASEFKRYSYDCTNYEYLLNINAFDNFIPDKLEIKLISVGTSNTIRSLNVTLSPITAYELPESAILFQAEDIQARYCQNTSLDEKT